MRIAPMALFVASSLGAFLLAQAGISTAAFRQWSTASCASSNASVVLIRDSTGMYQNSSAPVDAVCDVQDDTTYMKSSATMVNVYGYDGTTSDLIAAYACVTYRSGSGGTCGFGSVTGGPYTGNFDMPVFTNAWQAYPNDIAYIGVNIPRYGYGRVRGFRMTL